MSVFRIVVALVRNLVVDRSELAAENLALRQQLPTSLPTIGVLRRAESVADRGSCGVSAGSCLHYSAAAVPRLNPPFFAPLLGAVDRVRNALARMIASFRARHEHRDHFFCNRVARKRNS